MTYTRKMLPNFLSIKVLGMCVRGNNKNVKSFKTLMNKMYDVDLKY